MEIINSEGTTPKPVFHNWVDNYSSGFCSDQGHVWYYTNGFSGNIPKGIPCSCGAMISHYDVCPICGHERFHPRSRY